MMSTVSEQNKTSVPRKHVLFVIEGGLKCDQLASLLSDVERKQYHWLTSCRYY